jgi:hypothetical protein
VLAAINLRVEAGQAGLPLYIDLDDGIPNKPGSGFTVFTSSGASSIELTESNLGDAFHGEGTSCVLLVPPAPPTIPPIAAPTPPAGPDSPDQSSLHCPEDPTGDWNVDIFDVVLFTGAFAQTGPAYLDIYPDLVGDGFIDIFDIVKVTARFSQKCFGNSNSSSSSQTDSIPGPGNPYAVDCNSLVFGWPNAGRPPVNGVWDITDWGGRAFCYTNGAFHYYFSCFFEWYALYPEDTSSPWHLVAASDPVVSEGPRQYGGQYCQFYPASPNAYLPCNRQMVGWAKYNVRLNDQYGPVLAESFEPTGTYGYNLPC